MSITTADERPTGLGARAAIDATYVSRLLTRHLPAGRSLRVADCRVVRSRVRPGTRTLVQYAVRIDGAPPGDGLRVTVQWHADPARTARHHRQALAAAAGAGAAWPHPLPPVMVDTEAGLLATTFPCDPRLPGLWAIVAGDPALLAPMIGSAGIDAAGLAGVAIETARYREQLSAVCRYTLRRHGGTTAAFYVKAFADDSGAAVAARLDALAQATARAPLGAQVQPSVAWVPALRALVLAAAPGVPLDTRLATASPAACEATLRRVAAALATFSRATTPVETRGAADRAAATTRALEAIARHRPEVRTLDALGRAITNGLTDDARGLTHGDLKLEHVLVDDDRVSLIDLDSCHLGDPRWDLALLSARLDAAHLRAPDDAGGERVWRTMATAWTDAGGAVLERGIRGLRAAAWVDVAAGVLKRHEPEAGVVASRLLARARREVAAP